MVELLLQPSPSASTSPLASTCSHSHLISILPPTLSSLSTSIHPKPPSSALTDLTLALTLTRTQVGKRGRRASYSNAGASLFVAAPGGDREFYFNHVVVSGEGEPPNIPRTSIHATITPPQPPRPPPRPMPATHAAATASVPPMRPRWCPGWSPSCSRPTPSCPGGMCSPSSPPPRARTTRRTQTGPLTGRDCISIIGGHGGGCLEPEARA